MNDWLEAESRAERASHLAQSQRWSEALHELEAALAINPNEVGWHVQRGQILDQLQRYDEALLAYNEARELEPEQPELELLSGMDLVRTGRYEEANRLFEDLARMQPDFEPAYCHRIASYTRLGQHEQAEEMFYLAQQINPNCPNCFHHLAESLICRQQYDRAIYCWQRVLELSPEYPGVRQRIAQAYRTKGEGQRALEHYLSAYRRDPGSIDLLGEMGDLAIEMNDMPAAERRFRTVLELKPDCGRAHSMLGLLLLRNNDNEAAVLHLETAIALHCDSPGLLAHLGEAQRRRGNHYQALSHLSAALHENERDSVALMAMGNCLMQLNRPSEAEPIFERLKAVEGDSAGIEHNLAVCRFLLNDVDAGIERCLRALELDPNNLTIIHKLSLAYIHRRQWPQARAMIARGLAIDQQHEGLSALPKRFWVHRLCMVGRDIWRRGGLLKEQFSWLGRRTVAGDG